MPGGEAYVRASIFDGSRHAVYSYDKQYLVPQGEYVPYLYAGVLRLLGLGDVVERLKKDSAYQPGILTPANGVVPADIPGVLFCFESVRPDGVISLQRLGAVPFVVHPLSHGWFHQPEQLWHQLDTMLRIQSRYSGVPIVSAGNMVSGKLYLPNGQIETGEVVHAGDGWLLRKFVF
jgi:apolipoprotein N-acyltransferase